MYRVGIIGLGHIAVEDEDSHLVAYYECLDTTLVSVCDKDPKKRAICVIAEIPTTYYSDYMEMVKKEKLDIVSVCTLPETHCQIVCDIAPYVKAIYCEKPIATTLEETDKMIEACYNNNVILQVNHQRRFTKPIMRWSRGILNNGSHAFDLARQLCGENWQDKIEMEYIDDMTYPPIFELVITQKGMILKGVEHLIECLREGKQSISSGEEARETLRQVLEHERNR